MTDSSFASEATDPGSEEKSSPMTAADALAAEEQDYALMAQRASELEAARAVIEAELNEARMLAQHEKRRAMLQQRAHQRALNAYERETAALRRSIAFQLGEIMVRGFKSPGAFLKLPGELIAFRRNNVRQNGARGDSTVPELGGKGYPRLIERLNAEGYDAALAMIQALDLDPATLADAYTALSRHLRASDPLRCADAARLAHEADPKPWRAKWLAFRSFDAGELLEPSRLLRELPEDQRLSGSEETRSAQIHALADLFEIPPDLPFIAAPRYEPRPKSLLYVAASAPPYHLSGYTMRTAALLAALTRAGAELSVATRPGYPWDRHDSKGAAKAKTTVADGIAYHHFRHPAQNLPLDVYLEDAAATIAKLAMKQRVSTIHAASNHVNALPALIAARKIGVAFHYEIRGLWEMSRASNVDGFAASERYRLGLDLEAFVACNADRIYAISEPLADFLISEWGVGRERIAVLPNAVDRATFAPIEATRPPRFTIGYAGALVGYEGLDLLLEAVAQIRANGHDLTLQLIGDGGAMESLKSQARALKIEGAVEFLGKLPPEEARARIAKSSLVCLPRRPDKVCELIPPIKLVETMALGVPLIVPDLEAFRAEAEDGETARFFKAGDAADLARAITAAITDPGAMQDMAAAARARVLDRRDWSAGAAMILRDLDANEWRARARRAAQVQPARAETFADLQLDSEQLAALYNEQGATPLIAMLDSERPLAGKARAIELLRAGRVLCEAGLGDAEAALAEEALNSDRSAGVLTGAYRAFERAGAFDRTRAVLAELERHPDVGSDPDQKARVDRLKGGLAYQLELLKLIEPRRGRAFEPAGSRICYMLHNSLPYSSGGYATRSHGIATGLRDCGFDVIAMTRPGFPHDVAPDLDDGAVGTVDVIDGITYRRILEPRRKALKYVNYVPEAARVLEEQYRELRPSLVMAASNHGVALPALIACRRLGIAFVYEVRGFWEVTKMSRESEYVSTAAYKLQSRLETAVCKEADHVFTLTQPMRDELVERGASAEHIDLLPNSCDPQRFLPCERDAALLAELGIPDGIPVLGYVGTFVDYEGLDDLARACGVLKRRGKEFRLLLVGNENTSGAGKGPITEMIAAIAAEGGFSDWLVMPGRVPHEIVGRYYSLLDICPFPRKPWPVCEMVSPMKPLEALAMEKTVIVSSVRALKEMIADESTGLVFEKDNVEALADVLERAMGSPELRERLGRAGRQWVIKERTWRAAGQRAAKLLAPFVTPARTVVEQAQ